MTSRTLIETKARAYHTEGSRASLFLPINVLDDAPSVPCHRTRARYPCFPVEGHKFFIYFASLDYNTIHIYINIFGQGDHHSQANYSGSLVNKY